MSATEAPNPMTVIGTTSTSPRLAPWVDRDGTRPHPAGRHCVGPGDAWWVRTRVRTTVGCQSQGDRGRGRGVDRGQAARQEVTAAVRSRRDPYLSLVSSAVLSDRFSRLATRFSLRVLPVFLPDRFWGDLSDIGFSSFVDVDTVWRWPRPELHDHHAARRPADDVSSPWAACRPTRVRIHGMLMRTTRPRRPPVSCLVADGGGRSLHTSVSPTCGCGFGRIVDLLALLGPDRDVQPARGDSATGRPPKRGDSPKSMRTYHERIRPRCATRPSGFRAPGAVRSTLGPCSDGRNDRSSRRFP